MKTPEQLAAEINECAESIIRNLREDIAPELREDTWVWTAACHAKVIKEDIAALTEHAKGLEEKAHGFKLCFPYETIGNMNPALFKDGGYHYYVPEAELTALRARVAELELQTFDIKKLEVDKARLDWLEEMHAGCNHGPSDKPTMFHCWVEVSGSHENPADHFYGNTLRAAIDAARKEGTS